MILRTLPNCLLLLAPECSSWTVVSRGSTWRSIVNYRGLPGMPVVAKGNMMLSRSLSCMMDWASCLWAYGWKLFALELRLVLLLWLGCACRTIWVCEQPRGSEKVFVMHERFQQFCNEVCFVPGLHIQPLAHAPMIKGSCRHELSTSKVFKSRFWMMLMGASSPKRATIWTNEEKAAKQLVRAPASHGNALGIVPALPWSCAGHDWKAFELLKHIRRSPPRAAGHKISHACVPGWQAR